MSTRLPVRARSGLVAFGLPYASDPAITRHLAAFLSRHAKGEVALLLNGLVSVVGVLRDPAPVATISHEALAHNAMDMLVRAGGVPIRVASKSIRVRAVLDAILALPGYAGVDEYDTVSQSLLSHHISVRADGTGTENVTPQRYVWPSELDLMARISGMTLENRWEDFEGTPFTSESQKHVSVWVKED